MNQFKVKLLPLIALSFLTACSVESDKASAPQVKPKVKIKQRKQEGKTELTLHNKAETSTTSGFNAFRGEMISIQPVSFFWEKRDRGAEEQIDSATWGGCDSFRVHCWNKHSVTYSKELTPPQLTEIKLPLLNVQNLLEQIFLEFKMRSGSEVICSAASLMYEKSSTEAFLHIENTSECMIFQNETDEIYDVAFRNRVNFGEIKYTAGTFIAGDNGVFNNYTETKYTPDTLLNLKIVLGKTELKTE